MGRSCLIDAKKEYRMWRVLSVRTSLFYQDVIHCASTNVYMKSLYENNHRSGQLLPPLFPTASEKSPRSNACRADPLYFCFCLLPYGKKERIPATARNLYSFICRACQSHKLSTVAFKQLDATTLILHTHLLSGCHLSSYSFSNNAAGAPHNGHTQSSGNGSPSQMQPQIVHLQPLFSLFS